MPARIRATWQACHFLAAKLGLGNRETPGSFAGILGVSASQAQKMGRDPTYCSEVARNPFDRIVLLLRSLQEIGYGRECLDILALIAGPLGLEARPVGEGAHSPTGDVAIEFFEDMEAMGRLSAGLRECGDLGSLKKDEGEKLLDLLSDAILELHETMDAVQRHMRSARCNG